MVAICPKNTFVRTSYQLNTEKGLKELKVFRRTPVQWNHRLFSRPGILLILYGTPWHCLLQWLGDSTKMLHAPRHYTKTWHLCLACHPDKSESGRMPHRANERHLFLRQPPRGYLAPPFLLVRKFGSAGHVPGRAFQRRSLLTKTIPPSAPPQTRRPWDWSSGKRRPPFYICNFLKFATECD